MLRYLLLSLLTVLAGCKAGTVVQSNQPSGELIFQSGFEADSKVIASRSDADIVGTDHTVTSQSDWVNDLDNHPDIGNFNLQYQGGDSTMRFAKIIAEPGRQDNHVLLFWLDHPNVGEASKGRIQANLYGNKGFKEVYQSVRVFLHDDFNTVRQYPKEIHWLTIAEFWNNITWSQSVPNRFRITLGIGKPVSTPGDLHFIVDAQDCELFESGSQKYTTIWSEINRNFKVPIGKWFTMDYYYKEGNNENGRFYLSVTPEGESRQVIFDLKRITHNTTDANPEGLSDFNPLKLYTSKDLIMFMKSQGKTLQIYWDDFKLWKDKQPS